MKIVIIGNSVALRVRPPKAHPNNKNYTYCLKQNRPNDEVVNTALGAMTVLDITGQIDSFINHCPDWYVINLGVVEACSREAPLWLFRMATSHRRGILVKGAKILYGGIFARFRPFFTRLRMGKSWVNKSTFQRHFDLLMTLLLKETNAKIIVLGINAPSQRIEMLLPGSTDKIVAYNRVLEAVAAQHKQSFVDLSDLIADTNYPDGVHFNQEGHELIARRIEKYLLI